METFLRLEGAVEEEFQRLLVREEQAMARRTQMTWADEMREEGRLRGKREALLTVLTQRFGPVSEELEQRLGRVTAARELDALLKQAIAAPTLEQVVTALPT